MKRHSIVSTISCVNFLMLPLVAVSCGGETGGDLFVGGKPKTDAGNTGATGGTSATGGASGAGASGGGTGAQSSGGSAGAGDASAGASGTSGAAGTNGASGTAGIANSGGTAGIAGGGMSGSAGSNGTAGTAGNGGTAGIGNPDSSFGTGGIGNPDSSFGAGGTAGSAGADAGLDASADAGPKSCTGTSQCKSDEFCSKAACVNLLGECKPRPKACAATESPVCGCDGVNYWNDCLRQQIGSPSSTGGACLTPATCGGLASLPCPVGRARCAHLLTAELQCGVADAFGACWVIPEQCPQIVVGANQRACSGSTDRCISKCEAIKTEHDYFTDSTCPQ
jgi:hypothetical protein